MPLIIRPATPFDTAPMARLLNEIIAAGGTTAMTKRVSSDDLADWMQTDRDSAVWHVAEQHGEVLGFQFAGPQADLPPEACDIASFVQTGNTGLGIGSALFRATVVAVDRIGYDWINANIRADNDSGLTYYQSRGFRRYGMRRGVELRDGLVVDKVLMRYDLR